MREADAVKLAKAHAAEWLVPWRQFLRTGERSPVVEWYNFTVDTGDGAAFVSIHSDSAKVIEFEYYPKDPNSFLLPLWAAFPTYSSMTSGWRQASGEQYKYKWHAFYRGLSEDGKAEYRRKYPAPDDEERCWQGFYELIADKPATGEHPLAEFIIGRVP